MANRISILVVNPNSSSSMTAVLEHLLADLAHSQLNLAFYTAPSTAPPSINDEETSALSASETLPDLLKYSANPSFSAYLIACFSDHPLTWALREEVSAPVLNIFQASILHARMLSLPFGIVTTGKYWVPVLQKATESFFTGRIEDFVGVRSTGLSAIELHSKPHEEVHRRIADATADLVGHGARVLIMGCAGMSGMEEAVQAGAKSKGLQVTVIDGVRAGVVLLEGLVRSQSL
ncbi:Asp/Glu/hydantoin racemase [Cytidiella melzeri]|nr:Asp/Glu/hydantoin racemase [Cytidiella melzeri]